MFGVRFSAQYTAIVCIIEQSDDCAAPAFSPTDFLRMLEEFPVDIFEVVKPGFIQCQVNGKKIYPLMRQRYCQLRFSRVYQVVASSVYMTSNRLSNKQTRRRNK